MNYDNEHFNLKNTDQHRITKMRLDAQSETLAKVNVLEYDKADKVDLEKIKFQLENNTPTNDLVNEFT